LEDVLDLNIYFLIYFNPCKYKNEVDILNLDNKNEKEEKKKKEE